MSAAYFDILGFRQRLRLCCCLMPRRRRQNELQRAFNFTPTAAGARFQRYYRQFLRQANNFAEQARNICRARRYFRESRLYDALHQVLMRDEMSE